MFNVGSVSNQQELISDLSEKNLIISGGPSYGWDMPIHEKLPIVHKYIDENYNLLFEINNLHTRNTICIPYH